jgi:hypothetical protein
MLDEAPALRAPFDVRMDHITDAELRKAIQKRKSCRACKEGDVPIECFKALAEETGTVLG